MGRRHSWLGGGRQRVGITQGGGGAFVAHLCTHKRCSQAHTNTHAHTRMCMASPGLTWLPTVQVLHSQMTDFLSTCLAPESDLQLMYAASTETRKVGAWLGRQSCTSLSALFHFSHLNLTFSHSLTHSPLSLCSLFAFLGLP